MMICMRCVLIHLLIKPRGVYTLFYFVCAELEADIILVVKVCTTDCAQSI